MDNPVQPHPPSDTPAEPAYSDSESDEASARVWFGPIQSPEKKFTANIPNHRTPMKTPIRRSSRRASTKPRRNAGPFGTGAEDRLRSSADNEMESEDDPTEEGSSRDQRAGTPDGVFFPPDEPPSVLAGKIMRASSNPSPPPISRAGLEDPGPSHRQHALLVDISGPLDFDANALPIDATAPALNNLAHMPSAFPLNTEFVLEGTRIEGIPPPFGGSTEDLISFDSFDNTANPPLPEPGLPQLSTPHPPPSQPTIDELLSHSPIPPLPISIDTTAGPSAQAVSPSPPAQSVDSEIMVESSLRVDSVEQAPAVQIESSTTDEAGGQTVTFSEVIVEVPPPLEVSGAEPLPEPTNIQADHVNIQETTPQSAPLSIPADTTPEPTTTSTELPPVAMAHTPALPPTVSQNPATPPPIPTITATPVRRSARLSASPNKLLPKSNANPSPSRQSRRKLNTGEEQGKKREEARMGVVIEMGKGKEKEVEIGVEIGEGDMIVELTEEMKAAEKERRRVAKEKRRAEREKGKERLEKEQDQVAKDKESESKGKEKGKTRRRHMRELGSLSPTSADVLTKLIGGNDGPSSSTLPLPSLTDLLGKGKGKERASSELTPNSDSLSSPPQLEPEPQVSPQPVPIKFTVQRPTISQVFASTTAGPSSPIKFGSSLEDPSRTPARRIPISQAIAQGNVSPERAAAALNQNPQSRQGGAGLGGVGMGLLGSPVFKKVALDDPNRSPARRVPIDEAKLGGMKVVGSPAKSVPIRGGSSSRKVKGLNLPSTNSKHSTASTIWKPPPEAMPFLPGTKPSARSTQKSTLPFPITPVAPESPAESRVLPSVPSNSPGKSSLRQPSAGAGSRIPRIGSKPYARPGGGKVGGDLGTPAAGPSKTAKAEPASSAARPARVARTAGGGSIDSLVSSSSTDSVSKPVPSSSTSSSLKRKREANQISVPTSPAAPRRVAFGGSVPKASSIPTPTKRSAQLPNTIPVRKVADGPLHRRTPEIAQESVGKGKEPERLEAVVIELEDDQILSPVSPQATQPPTVSEVVEQPKSPSPVGASAAARGVPHKSPDEENNDPVADSDDTTGKVRRTSRQRKPTSYAEDVFGTVVTTVRPLQPRRRQPVSRSEEKGFTGLSAVALRALTSTNTTKNQHCHVKLETEVIRKPGPRPDSPTTKVRTILQKQQDEKGKDREARAQRRARRSEGSVGDTDGYSEVDDLSMMDEGSSELESLALPGRHLKGPGDEEEYETPERPDRPSKRGRFDEAEESRGEKSVKWDRALQKTVYLDDPPPEPKDCSSVVIPKPCLAPSAKVVSSFLMPCASLILRSLVTRQTLRLDHLGNVLNADSPLVELIPECVVVQKFVYEDDPAPEEEVAEEEEYRPLKSRRLRSKT
ncbi:hypothetical protein JAAARDRAFT_31818 [Jaapia argillacea MUCL 33604]|uniref:Uncharacterized protein n=1 Tax=Jaapia argillacea MUCL 33604 TaxID=933084 RepID=A0A067QE13_9AGAM|nr:hypothetical protein JAAARDRAFT_31818 [Jaapia argillacea MUCL 33604]